MTAPLLDVDNLHVAFATRRGRVEALRGVSFAVPAGGVLGIVGESGSGKSVASLAVMGLLDRAGAVTAGRIRFDGADITRAGGHALRRLRGAALSMIFQNPRAALNPIRAVGAQIADVLRAHRPLSAAEAKARAVALLEAVQIRDAARRAAALPHELSGGMCQRVMIAMAMACEPRLIIADEPTTGLDVTTQKAVMDLLSGLVRQRGMGLVLITHDLGLAAQYCDQVTVMEAGRVVESAPPARLFGAPREAYTRRLVAACPTPTSTIAGLTPDAPPLPPAAAAPPRPPGTPLLLEVQNLAKRYPDGTVAVDGVSFAMRHGESLGLVGESGSGKSTISRLVTRLVDATGGEVIFEGESIGAIPARDFHRAPQRGRVQIVFQDAGESLNPRFSAFDSIADPLRRLSRLHDPVSLRQGVQEAADGVGLPRALLDRYPHQLSGGQRARVGIARAIAVQPRLLVLDEPTAALDVSVQAVVLQLLERLRREKGLSYLFVSHDLNVVRMLCDRLIVLRQGRVVEQGESARVFQAPADAYTAQLIAAIPHFQPERALV
ncbi:ATP-binding cassette domain-containing protein [Roseomonas haemaphysalidis]|uniref:ABC transporter ATP-binding protein n=1 Tax=Roseomonas haemaphysalidis TaxID=2768162 RepID=A0ABS3KRK0_9PROT|nr:ABC transporter ATP-binding protein [Roseomonas haemaphysalidis]MBO1080108.1 ABC transporter ATP-binding protein [Roseomonas haemaphysalidis]